MTEPNDIVSALLDQAETQPEPEPSPQPDPVPKAPESEPQTATADPEPAESERPATLKEYAEKHNLDLNDLYGLQTSSGKTLSELSDAAKEFESLNVSKTEFEGERDRLRLDRQQFNQAVANWAALVEQGKATPDALRELQVQQQNQLEQARLQTLELIPEWTNPDVKANDLSKAATILSGFGFSEQDVKSIVDPRTHLMVQRLVKLEQRFSEALGAVKAQKQRHISTGKKAPKSAPKMDGLSPEAAALLNIKG